MSGDHRTSWKGPAACSGPTSSWHAVSGTRRSRTSSAGVELGREAPDDPQSLVPALIRIAWAYLQVGRVSDAEAAFAEAIPLLEKHPYARPWTLPEVAFELGESTAIHEILAGLPPSPGYRAMIAVLDGYFAEAAELYAEAGILLFEAEARLRAAEQLLAEGRTAEGEAAAREGALVLPLGRRNLLHRARRAAPLEDRLTMAEQRRERKVVTVVFCDLVGFTQRAEQLDPEDVEALLGPYHERLRSELERYGGTVEKFIGDAVMALFGAPVAHEDDPERAVRACLAIRDWAIEEDDVQVRIAVTTGEALIRLDARPEAGEGMASGDVVNTAARLQNAAPVNGILTDETTYRATRRVVDYGEAPAVEAKGKAEPIAGLGGAERAGPLRRRRRARGAVEPRRSRRASSLSSRTPSTGPVTHARRSSSRSSASRASERAVSCMSSSASSTPTRSSSPGARDGASPTATA